MKAFFCIAVAAAIGVGLSVAPSSASTCAGTCTNSVNGVGSTDLGSNPSSVGFFDSGVATGTSIADEWQFTLSPPPPPAYGGFANEITLGIANNAFINNLTFSVWATGGLSAIDTVSFPFATQAACQASPSCANTSQTVTLGIPSLTAPGSYFLKVTGTAGENLTYSGTLGLSPIPLPGTIALFVGGLGLLGFAGARKGRRSGRIAAAT